MPCLHEYGRDARGNVAVTFALVLSFLCLCAGVAIDFAVAVDRKRSTDQAIDQAALAATAVAMNARQDGHADWAERGRDMASKVFNANLPTQTNYKVTAFEPEVTFGDNTIKTIARYRAHSSTSFMKLFMKDTVAFEGQVQAVSVAPSYIDLHFLIDGSASMGIGADISDQQKMINSSAKCAFACHQDTTKLPSIAHAAGATLRIDVIRQAVKNVIDQIIAKKPRAGTVRVAFHVFSADMTTVLPLTSNLVTARAETSKIDMVSGVGGASYVSHALSKLASSLVTAGDGSADSKRASFVVFLSDGIDDTANVTFTPSFFDMKKDMSKWKDTSPAKQMGDKSYMQAFSPAGCTSMKGKQSRVLAVQIKYLVAPGIDGTVNPAKIDYVTTVLAQPLTSAFASCSTTPATDHVVAHNSAAIGPVLSQVLDQVILPQIARLAN